MDSLCLCLVPIKCELFENDRLCGRSSEEKLNEFKQKEILVRKIGTGLNTVPPFQRIPDNIVDNNSSLCNALISLYALSTTNGFNISRADLDRIFAETTKLRVKTGIRAKTFGKTITGLLGHFSSAKSSFLNCFLNFDNVLPVDDTRTTAIPTYIIASKTEALIIENTQNQLVFERDTDLLLKLKYGRNPCEFQWQSIVKNIYYFSENIDVNPNVIYLDLPGTERDDTDNSISIDKAIECDKILYFADISKGALSNVDIGTLKLVCQNHIPTLIILSKTDNKKLLSEANDVFEQVKEDLCKNSIEYDDIVMYTSQIAEITEEEYLRRLSEDRKKIRAFINKSRISDLNELNTHWKSFDERISEFIDWIKKRLNKIETQIEDIEDNKLGNKFFNGWKNIVKDILEYEYVTDDLKKFNNEYTFYFNECEYNYPYINLAYLHCHDLDAYNATDETEWAPKQITKPKDFIKKTKEYYKDNIVEILKVHTRLKDYLKSLHDTAETLRADSFKAINGINNYYNDWLSLLGNQFNKIKEEIINE